MNQGFLVPEGRAAPRRLLVVDDDPTVCDLLDVELTRRNYAVVTHTSPKAAVEQLAFDDFDAVISDVKMAGMTGIELCRRVVALREDIPFIVMTAHASVESAVASIRAGAYDFVVKPFEGDDLFLTLERALKRRGHREGAKRLGVAKEPRPFDEMLGDSAVMRAMYALIDRAAEAEATVLVTGESGTGKELVARSLHDRSPRAAGPFVAVNCAAFPEHLLESELFGHVKGAFTDARSTRAGLFVAASGGTLFLDEVGDMPLAMQSKLLRALQERTVRAVGGDTETPFGARIIAATNRDLEVEVAEKRFREDLCYRINVVCVCVPPLRDRENDVLALAAHFLRRSQPDAAPRVVGLSAEVAQRLTVYPWPGNVRELQNCVERAMAVARSDRIGLEDLPDRVGTFVPGAFSFAVTDVKNLLSMDQVSRRYAKTVLDAVDGNKAHAARVLGFDRKTLYRKLDRWARAAASLDARESPFDLEQIATDPPER